MLMLKRKMDFSNFSRFRLTLSSPKSGNLSKKRSRVIVQSDRLFHVPVLEEWFCYQVVAWFVDTFFCWPESFAKSKILAHVDARFEKCSPELCGRESGCFQQQASTMILTVYVIVNCNKHLNFILSVEILAVVWNVRTVELLSRLAEEGDATTDFRGERTLHDPSQSRGSPGVSSAGKHASATGVRSVPV